VPSGGREKLWWPSAGSFVAAYGQDLMAADIKDILFT